MSQSLFRFLEIMLSSSASYERYTHGVYCLEFASIVELTFLRNEFFESSEGEL